MKHMTRLPRVLLLLALAALALLVAAACSGDDEPPPGDADSGSATSTATPGDAARATASATRTLSASPAPSAPVEGTAAGATPRATATATLPPLSGGGTGGRPPARRDVVPTGTPPPPASPAAGERTERAPIESIDVIWTDATTPRLFWVDVTSGLPNGCARLGGVEVSRAGTTITITVTNITAASPTRACTQLYGYVTTTVPLGSDFVSGARYTIRANDKTETFTAP
jgi:hypothetical protein